MNTIIRTHVKNVERLKLLKLTLESSKDKKLHRVGQIFIADDQSPMNSEVQAVAMRYKAKTVISTGKPSTCNGMFNALEIGKDWDYGLYLCDDVLLGGEFKEKLNKIESLLPSGFGAVSLFIPESVDQHFRKGDTEYFYKCDASSPLFHAWICTVISKELNAKYRENYQSVISRHPDIQDDHAIRMICEYYKLGLYCTKEDWALHTGINNRAFDDPDKKQGASTYQCKRFAGSKEDRKGF